MAPKRNGFFFFMLEVQRRERERGVQCNFNTAQRLADPLWKNMSEGEKQRYNDMAKESNAKNGGGKKYTSGGLSFDTVDSIQRAKIEALNIMNFNIKSCIEKLHKRNELRSHPFFVAHVNYYFMTDEKYFVPAEFAIAVFSFEKGFFDKLHFFVALGEIPLGYKLKIKERSEQVHRIPFDSSWKEGLRDYSNMYEKVYNFIQEHSSDRELPPIYTMPDDLNKNYSDSAVRCALETMCEAARIDSSAFRVYQLDKLFHEIVQILRPGEFFSTALMRAELEKDSFSYAQNLGCFLHDEIDWTIHCSLSIVARWIFTMCDHCCKFLNIKLILGYHVPSEVDVNWGKVTRESIDDLVTPAMENLSFINETEKDTWNGKGKKVGSNLKQGDAVRFPKTLMSAKIGAKFDADPDSSSVPDSTDPDEDTSNWTIVETGKKHGLGRGRAIPVQNNVNRPTLPTSGRGRLVSMKK